MSKLQLLPVTTIEEVVQRQLCTGCGICASVEPERFAMHDAVDWGKRPYVRPRAEGTSGQALQVCPGASLDIREACASEKILPELKAGWGPVQQVWEGYATDPQIRHAGSSGGAATALSLFAIQHAGFAGVVHTAADEKQPLLNTTVMSRNRDELLARTGSRYAPASPCDSLHEQLPSVSAPVVFVGKPCDVAAVQQAIKHHPEWQSKLGLTIAFFCAGVPSTRGTLNLLAKMGMERPEQLKSLRYRGRGWPGMFTAEWLADDGALVTKQLTYDESWGYLQSYRQWRCYICPDHTGEFADISVGDPWYRKVEEGELGSSLIVVRTERGREFLAQAAAAGFITLTQQDASLLPRSQPNLLNARGGLWGRTVVLRFLGAAVPTFLGFELKRFWWRLTVKHKIQSFSGTWKRVFRKRLRERIPLNEFKAPTEHGQ